MSNRTDTSVDLIERLLDPVDRRTFLDRYWEREWLHVARDDAGWFADLFGVDELDRLLADVRLPATNLDLAQDSTPLPKGAYAADGFVDLASVMKLHADGATIILRSLEQWCRPLDDLTRAATATFGTPSQINVYATPPANQSTPPHWDTHDLFILQVHGEKVWNLYDADHELPLEDERFDASTFSVGPLREKVLLRPGDVLYLPRGTIHEPQADTYSIHVSLGLIVTRLADVLVEMVRLAARHVPELRRGLPPALAGVPQAKVEAELVDAMRQLASRDVAEVVLRHREVGVASARPPHDDRLVGDLPLAAGERAPFVEGLVRAGLLVTDG